MKRGRNRNKRNLLIIISIIIVLIAIGTVSYYRLTGKASYGDIFLGFALINADTAETVRNLDLSGDVIDFEQVETRNIDIRLLTEKGEYPGSIAFSINEESDGAGDSDQRFLLNTTFGHSTQDSARGVDFDSSGNIIVTGESNGEGYVRKYDGDGNLLWNKPIAKLSSIFRGGYGVDTDNSNNIYVIGRIPNLVIKYDSNGNVLMNSGLSSKIVDGGGTGIATDSGNNFVIVGHNINNDIVVEKYSSTGSLLWNKTYGGSLYDHAYDVSIDGSGNVYVTGLITNSTTSTSDLVLLKYDSNGNILWNKLFSGKLNEKGYGVSVGDTGVFVTGSISVGGGNEAGLLLKYDSNGNILWNKTFSPSSQTRGNAVAVGSDGKIYITGQVSSLSTRTGLLFYVYDQNGNVVSSHVLDTPLYESGNNIAVDPSGKAAIVGFKETTQGYDSWLLIYGVPESSSFSVSNNAPYYLSGSTGVWSPLDGTYTITATAYSEPNGQGYVIDSISIPLTIIGGGSLALPSSDLGVDLGIVLNAAPFSGSHIMLTWNDIPGASSYLIERSTNINGPWAQIKEVDGNNVSYRDYSLSSASTYFYRMRAILDSSASTYDSLDLEFKADDGAIFYINGQEIYRFNMLPGEINYKNLSESYLGEYHTFNKTILSSGVLKPGANIMAVEVHQVNNQSSDLSFDLSLNGISSGMSTSLIQKKSVWKYNDKGLDLGISWRNEVYDDSLWGSGSGELGYGDGDETTLLKYGPYQDGARYITHYFRKSFDSSLVSGAITGYSNTASAKTYTQGLKGEYYSEADPVFTGTKIERIDSRINFNWSRGYPHGYTAIGSDNFSVKWTGYIVPRYTGEYTFYTESDDGAKLYIDNILVVNDWSIHPARERNGTVFLDFNEAYPIRLEYFENEWDAVIKLRWSSSQQNKEIVPPTRIFTITDAGGTQCTDSDGGVNYNVRGNTCLGDACNTDSCSGSTLTEYSCSNNQVVSTTNNCANGCSNGACLSVQPPAIPSGFTATAVSFSEINLQWNAVSGATSYKVERSTSATSGFTQIGISTTNSFKDSGLNALTTYYYRIRASNSAGNSGYTIVKNATTLDRPTDEFRWTDLRPSSDSKMIYVSSSEGNDNNNGSSPTKAVKTLSKAYSLARDGGKPDWIWLKKGDKWSTPFPSWYKKGRSNSERMVITSYGSGARPIVSKKIGDEAIFPARADNLAIVGIHFRGYYDSKSLKKDGVELYYYADNILIEDSYFEGVRSGIRTHNDVNVDGIVMQRSNIAIRGSVFSNNYGEGIYMSAGKNVLIEGNIFYHNEWHEGDLRYYDSNSPKSSPSERDHAIYMQYYNENVTVRNNIIADSFEGLALRSGGVVDNNLFLRPSRGMTLITRKSTVKDNVFLEPKIYLSGQSPRGLEIMPVAKGTVVEGNIVANSLDNTRGNAYLIQDIPTKIENESRGEDMWWYVNRFDPYGVTFRNNIAYDAGLSFTVGGRDVDYFTVSDNIFYNQQTSETSNGLCFQQNEGSARGAFTYKDNIFWCNSDETKYKVLTTRYSFSQWKSWASDSGSVERDPNFVDPERTVARYNSEVLRRSGGYSDFIRKAINQSKDNWRPEYMASEVNNYIRSGFEET